MVEESTRGRLGVLDVEASWFDPYLCVSAGDDF
jgi:hypothetical protein